MPSKKKPKYSNKIFNKKSYKIYKNKEDFFSSVNNRIMEFFFCPVIIIKCEG